MCLTSFGTSAQFVEKFWRKRKKTIINVKESKNVTVNEAKRSRLDGHKRASVQTRYCQDCEESQRHSTGSQLWLSCRLQKGWRSINSECNLPNPVLKRFLRGDLTE